MVNKSAITTVIILFLASFVFAGTVINTPKPTTLNTSTYTAITSGTQDAYGFSIYISGQNAYGIYIAVDSAGTGETLLEPGDYWFSWPDFVPYNSTVMYGKAVVGTPGVTFFPAKRGDK